MKYTFPCVIFAGGKSSRMGEDKSLLPFGGFDTLIEYQYTKLSHLFTTVYISTKEDNYAFTCKCILDNSEVYAPTAGFVSLFKHLDTQRVFVLSVDTPFIGATEIQKLIDEDNDSNDATIACTSSSRHPMCGIYHRSLMTSFSSMLEKDNHKLGMLLKSVKTKWVEFEDEEAFMNLNHPHEYEEALLRVGVKST